MEAKVDWIDSNGAVLKYGAVKTFYVPVKPKINRYQVAMYDYTGGLAAKAGSGGNSGAVYVGQTTYPQYTYTSDNTWTSYNNFRGELNVWKTNLWQSVNGTPDLSVNARWISKSTPYIGNSTLYPYRVVDNSSSGINRIPFKLTTQWTSDPAHTTDTTGFTFPL